MKRSRPFYHGPLVTVEKATRWKACSPATAAELLEQDDIKTCLTPEQRETMLAKAGKKYKADKASALVMRKGETKAEYIARIQKLLVA